jgi:polyhydroxybutyrate depolymerase
VGPGGVSLFTKANNVDVLFIEALIGQVKGTYCLDENRVFATGSSRGGYFANHIACILGGLVKGTVSHAGGDAYDASGTHFQNGVLVCPGQPIPVMVQIGQNDGLLQFAKKAKDYFRVKNGCQATTSADPPAPCTKFNGCTKTVKYCEIPGLGHAVWNQGTSSTWDFFMSL